MYDLVELIFNADIVNNDNFESFKYKAKLNTVAQDDNTANGILKKTTIASFKYKAKLNTVAQDDNTANGILKKTTIAALLKYLRSLEMLLLNCKVELKLRWTKHFVLSVAGTDNANPNNNDNDIIFTIKDIKLYVPVVTASVKVNQKLSKRLSKGFQRSVYWN